MTPIKLPLPPSVGDDERKFPTCVADAAKKKAFTISDPTQHGRHTLQLNRKPVYNFGDEAYVGGALRGSGIG